MEMSIPIVLKCPHCGREAAKIELPIPIEKIGEIFKNFKK